MCNSARKILLLSSQLQIQLHDHPFDVLSVVRHEIPTIMLTYLETQYRTSLLYLIHQLYKKTQSIQPPSRIPLPNTAIQIFKTKILKNNLQIRWLRHYECTTNKTTPTQNPMGESRAFIYLNFFLQFSHFHLLGSLLAITAGRLLQTVLGCGCTALTSSGEPLAL